MESITGGDAINDTVKVELEPRIEVYGRSGDVTVSSPSANQLEGVVTIQNKNVEGIM